MRCGSRTSSCGCWPSRRRAPPAAAGTPPRCWSAPTNRRTPVAAARPAAPPQRCRAPRPSRSAGSAIRPRRPRRERRAGRAARTGPSSSAASARWGWPRRSPRRWSRPCRRPVPAPTSCRTRGSGRLRCAGRRAGRPCRQRMSCRRCASASAARTRWDCPRRTPCAPCRRWRGIRRPPRHQASPWAKRTQQWRAPQPRAAGRSRGREPRAAPPPRDRRAC